MIPQFPHFEKLSLTHKHEIEQYVAKFPPYSDFNFTSLWTYNTDDLIEVSLLNENLVVKFSDYMTLRPFYSFLGVSKIQKTINSLFEQAKNKKMDTHLKLIPEIVITSNLSLQKSYLISEDLDNNDYIVSTEEVMTLPHHKYRTKMQQVAQFKKLYPEHTIRLLNLNDGVEQQMILNLFSIWEKNANKDKKDTENELSAIKRLLTSISLFQSYCLGIFYNKKLIGFTIFEMTHDSHGIYSFQKADRKFKGIFTFMCHEVAKELHKMGSKFINYEQDLGITGLRTAKSLWKPVHHLKKYIIRRK